MFKVETSVPMEVHLPIDLLVPPIVKIEGMAVVADWGRLTIQPDVCTFKSLDRARTLARGAIDDLQQTPLNAVGYNVVFRSRTPIAALRDLVGSPADALFADAGMIFSARSLGRQFPWNDGKINTSVNEEEDGAFVVRFNFDRSSPDIDHHRKWLDIPIEEVRSQTRRILIECMQIDEGDIHDIGTA
jgi:hypothetical protein